jgi:aryl-alcohol dehydrogenase-like predicted oxidoreductase
MEYTHLGRTGLRVSRVVLGTMNFGPQTSEEDSHAIMDAAHTQGVNFFDTANVYGQDKGRGATEEIVGRFFAQGGGRREKTVLATKLYGNMSDYPNEGKLSALNIRRALDASLTRLQTDYIDLYQFHHIDRDTPWEEIWQAIEVAVQQGKILYTGSSNFAGWHIAQAQEAAKSRHFTGLVSEQSIYNLIVDSGSFRGHHCREDSWPAFSTRRPRDRADAPAPPRSSSGCAPSSSSTRPSPRSSATPRANSRSPGCCTSPP